MRFTRSFCGLGFVLALAAPSAWAQDAPVYSPFGSISSPYCARDQVVGTPAPGAATTTAPATNGQPVNGQPVNGQNGFANGGDLASASGMSSGLASGTGGGMPGMIGDFIGPYSLVQVPFLRIAASDGSISRGINLEALPILSRGAYKIGENESPQPQDRVFVNFNYYRIEGTFPDPSPTINAIDVYRTTVGFEKTFLNAHASIGARLPFFSSYYSGRDYAVGTGDELAFISYDNSVVNLDESELGDVTLILKFATGCCKTGKLCAFGVAATIPTGPDIDAFDPASGLEKDIHSGILQPFFGYLYTTGQWYIHGFHSVAFPLHTGDDPIIFFNSLGVGYYCYGEPECAAAQMCGDGGWYGYGYGGEYLTSIVPTLEVHYNSALDNGGRFDYTFDPSSGSLPTVSTGEIVKMSNSFVLTGGVHLGLMGKSTLTFAAAIPLTVHPFDVEGIIQLNWRF